MRYWTRRDGARAQRPQPFELDVRNVKRTVQAACCGGHCAALISALLSLLRGRNYGCLACCTLVLQGRGHPQRHADEGCGVGGCRLGNGTRSEILQRELKHISSIEPMPSRLCLIYLRMSMGWRCSHLKCLCASGMLKNIKTRSLSAQGQGPARALLSFMFLPLYSRLTQHLRAGTAMAWLGAESGTGVAVAGARAP